MALVTNIPLTSATVEPLSRHEMLLWVNECLQAEFAKLEQLHTGAGYCLFTEILFPGSIQMKKVKMNSRSELDWLANWKIVQTSWKQLGVEKVIPVEKLIKGKFQDNFEFLQWFKKFFDANYDGHPYNPVEMRNYEELPKEGKLKANSGGTSLKMPQGNRKNITSRQILTTPPRRAGSDASVNSGSGGGTTTLTANKKTTTLPPTSTNNRSKATVNSLSRAPVTQIANTTNVPASNKHTITENQLIEEMKHKNRELEELRNQLGESDDVIVGLERERDFYFAKLRKIEVLCQENETAGKVEVSNVLQILYETEEGFAPPDDGSNGKAEEEEEKNENNGAV